MTTEATKAEVYWVECVRRWFPDLHTRTYLVPPVHLNRVPYADVTVAGQHVLVPQEPHEDPVQPAQIRGSREEVMVVLSQLQFGDYLNMPCYAAAAAQLPGPKDLDKKFHRGDFDILAVHRQYGLLICEIKSVGGNTSAHGLTERELRDTVMKKTRLAVKQLDKAEMVLSHIVSDLAPGLTVRKSFVLPSVTRSQLQQALSENPDVAQMVERDASGRVKLLKYNFWKLEDVHAALDVLVKRVSTEGRLYVLVDEAGPHIK
nr:hypothetical protein BaRGS_031355 [Batillaria attramentaria]